MSVTAKVRLAGWVRAVSKALAVSLVLATAPGLIGCGSSSAPTKKGVATGCTLNSDCDSNLVCSFGLCHTACKATKDCTAPATCVVGPNGDPSSAVCKLPNDTQTFECVRTSQCTSPLICGPDQQCRTPCATSSDCLIPGQVCAVGGVCADPTEVDPGTNKLKDAVLDAGTEGGAGSGGTSGTGGTGATGGSSGSGGTSGSGGGVSTGGGGPDGSAGTGGTTGTCTAGGSCTFSNECHTGVNSCDANNNLTCTDGGAKSDGTACGGDAVHVCSAGNCVPCNIGDSCSTDACQTATFTSCNTGPVCGSPTSAKDGTNCGSALFCFSGTCSPCNDGPCTPADNDCHNGTRDCSTSLDCVDANTNLNDGTTCTSGGGTYCKSGACTPCSINDPCQPAANPCYLGTVSSCTGGPTCTAGATPAPDGTSCGAGQVCISQNCSTATGWTLKVTSGDAQSKRVDEVLAPVKLSLVDSTNKALANVTLQVSAPAGAYAPATIKTDATGAATLNPQLGRAIGSYKFTVSVATYTASFSATAVAPAAGALFDLVNQTHTAVSGATAGGPAPTFATYYYTPSVVVASDGTLYFDDYGSVYSISPAGVLTRIAGTGTYGNSSSDTGPATSIQLYLPQGLALDQTNGYLYIADYDSAKVRRVYLTGAAAGSMDLLAGGGTAGSPDYGDGGSGDQATLASPQQVSVDSSGNVYIGDSGHNRIRKVDTNDTITAYISPYQTNVNTPPGAQTCSVSLAFYGCATNCGVTFDAKGQAFISGNFCGSQVPGTSASNSGYGVARVEADGSLTLVAGGSSSSATGDNLQATSAYFPSVPSIAFDKGGNLFASIQGANKVRRIDAATGVITTVAGSGTAGYKGDYADAATGATAEFNAPTDIAFDASGNLYVADYNDYTVRAIWGVGSATANTVAMAIFNGNNQSANVDAILSPPLAVKVTSGAGATAISGATVTWTALTAGSGFSASNPTVATSQSSALGTASISGRVGLSTGTYQFTASYRDIHGNPATGSPATFNVTATAATTGNIFTIVNTSHASGTTSTTIPGTFAQTNSAAAIAVGGNGNMYIGDSCQVGILTPKGVYTPLAGNGQCASGSVGDGGNASDARLYYIQNLALDEVSDPTNRILYINDYDNNRIRYVTLDDNPPQINTFVGYTGSGTAPGSPDYGVPGPGTGVNLAAGYGMAFNPGDKCLYYVDGSNHQRILKIDADTKSANYGNVTVLMTANASCSGTINIYNFSSGYSQIAWASGNVAYISAYLCGTDTSGNGAYGIMKYVAATKALTHIAGAYSTGSQSEGATALNTYFPALGGIAIGPGGNSLYVTTYNYNSIREITALDGTGKVNTIAGSTGSASTYSGDYVAATSASFYYPWQLAFSGSHLIVTDYNNYAFREIW